MNAVVDNKLYVEQMPTLPEPPELPNPMDIGGGWRARLPGLPEILRFVGAGILVSALSVFLFQRWAPGNDLYHYLSLLALSAGLTGAGLVSGLALHESKGARVFLGLVLLTLPIHFTVLGGLLYSQFAWETVRMDYPGMVTWQATDPGLLLMSLVAAFVVLLPACWLGVKTFVRPLALPVTLALFGLSLPLLLPTRSLGVVATLALVMALTVVWLELRVWRRRVAMKTPEGRFLRGLLMLPFVLILGRGLWLYDTSLLLVAVAAVAVYGLLLVGVVQHRDRPQLATALGRLSLFPAAVASWGLASALGDAGLPASYDHLVMAVPFVAALMLLARVSVSDHSGYRLAAALVAVMVTLGDLLVFGGVFHALLALVVGVATLSYGYLMEQKLVLGVGVLTAVVGLGFQVGYAVEGFALGGWLVLAVVGTLAILSASLLERYGAGLVQRWQKAREQLSGWDY
jgi:hypothetical protein